MWTIYRSDTYNSKKMFTLCKCSLNRGFVDVAYIYFKLIQTSIFYTITDVQRNKECSKSNLFSPLAVEKRYILQNLYGLQKLWLLARFFLCKLLWKWRRKKCLTWVPFYKSSTELWSYQFLKESTLWTGATL